MQLTNFVLLVKVMSKWERKKIWCCFTISSNLKGMPLRILSCSGLMEALAALLFVDSCIRLVCTSVLHIAFL